MKLHLKIALLIALIIAALMAAVFFGQNAQLRAHLVATQNTWIDTMVRGVADIVARDVLKGDKLHARELLRRTVQSDTGVAFIYVSDFDGRLFTHTFDQGFPRAIAENLLSAREGGGPTIYQSDQFGTVRELTLPLIEGMDANLHIGVSEDAINAVIARARNDLAWVIVAVSLAGIVVALALGARVSYPLRNLAAQIVQAGKGGMEDKVSVDTGDPDVEEVASAFNALSEARTTMERELRESEERFRDFAVSSSDWLWETGPDLRFTFLSDWFEAATGISKSAVLGKTREELGQGDIGPEKWARHLDDLHHHRAFRNFEYLLPNDAGKDFHAAISGVPVFDKNGDFQGFRGTGTDITALKSAQAALLESERRFREFAETASDWYWVTDADHRFVELAAGYRAPAMKTADFYMGKTRQELAADLETNPDWPRHLEDLDHHRPFRNFVFQSQRAEGVLRWIRTHGNPVFGPDGTFQGYRGTASDITDQMSLEVQLRQADKMKSLGQLTGGIAHDFNNILGIVIGNLELMRQKAERDPEIARWVDKASQGARRGAELTQRLLRFSRQDVLGGKVVSVNQLILDLDDVIRKSLTQAIEVSLDLDEDVWPTEIDPGDFSDAMINLALNARDAMAQGGRLSIRSRNTHLGGEHVFLNDACRPGDFVELEVRDTGIGIDKEIVDKVFEPFFSTKERGKGTGLGLSMVFGFVQRSGGDIALETQAGGGTVVRIFLPRSIQAEDQDGQSDQPMGADVKGTETVLVVDDEPDLLHVAEQYLEALGYVVYTASNGEEAFNMIVAHGGIDLVFSDVIMPGAVNGFELVRRAREVRPDVKFLLTSGFLDSDALSKSSERLDAKTLQALNEDLLPKPYTQRGLGERVRRVLERIA